MKVKKNVFKQPAEDGSRRCSIVHDGKRIFSPTEAKKVRPDLVEEREFLKGHLIVGDTVYD